MEADGSPKTLVTTYVIVTQQSSANICYTVYLNETVLSQSTRDILNNERHCYHPDSSCYKVRQELLTRTQSQLSYLTDF
jgi:hypothetical protein